MPPTIEDCVTYYESLGIDKFLMPYKITFFCIYLIIFGFSGGNTTEVDMMDIATISSLNDPDFNKSASFLGLDKVMETPPIGVQKWVVPFSGVFT